MKWPFVSRARYDRVAARNIMAAAELAEAEEKIAIGNRHEERRVAEMEMARHNLAEMRRMYDDLLDKYHALKLQGAALPDPAPVIEPVDEPDVPPDEVLLAMRQISPVRDKTYEANWQHWERNKEKARAYPKEFAEEIILGAVFESDDLTRSE